MDFAIVFALFCDYAPLWLVLHYATQRRRAQGLTHGEEKLLSDLWRAPTGAAPRQSAGSHSGHQVTHWRDKT